MRLIVFGATEVGYMIAGRLCQEHDITVIDESERLPEKFSTLDVRHVTGSGTDITTLVNANEGKVGLFIACSQNDEANIVACWTIKKISDIETVCFVSRGEIYNNLVSDIQHRYQTRYDIDNVIWPEQLLTEDIFRIVMVPDAIDVEYFDGGRAKLFEYRVKEDSPLCNMRVMDCDFPDNVIIVGITHDGSLSIPGGQAMMRLDDKVVFMGTGQALDLLAVQLSKERNTISSAVIIGGGNVGFFLARQMESSGLRVKIIDHDEKRCSFLAVNLEKSLVLQGDGTDIELLEEEAVGQQDVVICVTNNDEKNLLCSLLAKKLGAQRIITRTSSERNGDLFERVGVDVVVSPRESAMKEILNLMEVRDEDILAFVAGGQGEVLRIEVPKTFPDTQVMGLRLPEQAVIGALKRGKRVLIPNGQTTVCAGDILKVFTLTESTGSIQDVFKM